MASYYDGPDRYEALLCSARRAAESILKQTPGTVPLPPRAAFIVRHAEQFLEALIAREEIAFPVAVGACAPERRATNRLRRHA